MAIRLGGRSSPRWRILGAILLVGLTGAIFYVNSKDVRELNSAERFVLRISGPAQAVVTSGWRWLADNFREYVALVDLQRENLRLVEEVRVLRSHIQGAREVELENVRLRRLLQLGERLQVLYRPARVIAYDPASPYRTLRLDRGSDGGVGRNMAVVTTEGVVGRILRVWAGHSDVLLITDTRSGVDCLIQRTRERGTLEGVGTGSCRLKYLMRTADIRDGDVVITSGFDGIYPRGVVVGVVRSAQARSAGVFQEVDVLPAVDLTRVEEVLVLESLSGPLSDQGWDAGP